MSELHAALALRYPGFELNVDLHLPAQGVSVLLGPSGCGKTSVLRAMAGLTRAQGRVALGDDTWQDDERGRPFVPTHQRPIGVVFQEASLFPHLTVRGNLDYGRRRVPQALQRIHLDEAVNLLGIGHLLHRSPDRLSGGERQRVAIARALLTSPRLLLMDEPLSALDGPRKAEILPYLERLNRELDLPMVYVTHAHDEAARLADHLVLMAGGQVQASGPADELMVNLSLSSNPQDAAALLTAQVVSHDEAYGQTRLAIGAHHLWVGLLRQAVGSRVRVRVLARDVSVALSRAPDSSISNIVPAVLEAMREDGVDTVTLRLRLAGEGESHGASMLLARITRRSAHGLGLHLGMAVYAQIKGVALIGDH